MATKTELPSRTNTVKSDMGNISDDEAVPSGDPSSTTGLLAERLQAWKHMCGYLENYIEEVAKKEKAEAKDQEKILKTLSHPLREGHHFDQSIGGIAGLFENLRTNTQARANLHIETSKSLTGSVLPILNRLHAEIKNKSKELASGAGKGAKAVEAARNTSQKHIELLGQHTAAFDSAGGKVTAQNDPYVLQRGVLHRLNKQIMEENNNRQDLISVQNSFQQFEAHVLTTVQTAFNSYNQFMSGQADRQKAMFGDMAATAGKIPHDFEWSGFVKRNGNVLINPNAPSRSMDNVSFANQGHRATRALIEGSLEHKSRHLGALKGYSSGYFVVTPAGYLHEFKDNDNFHKDPVAERSLYLPDCTIGAVDGTKFTIKGRDSSGNKLAQKMAMSSELSFKAHTPADAEKWHSIIASKTSAATEHTPASVPTSPVEDRKVAPIVTEQPGVQQHGTTSAPQSAVQQQGVTSAPQSAVQQPGVGAGPQGTVAPTHQGDFKAAPQTTMPPAQQGAFETTPQSATATHNPVGSVPQGPTAGQAPATATSTAPVNTQQTHYYGNPGANELGERQFVGDHRT